MKTIILMGESGAGKSTAGRLLVALFGEAGKPSEFVTSKEFLGREILEDAINGQRVDNQIHTENQILYNADVATTTTFGAKLLNGSLLNRAHFALLEDTARSVVNNDGTIRITEIANGPKIFYEQPNAEPAHQTAEDFFNWMGQLGLTEHAIVWEIRSPFNNRVVQNRERGIGVIPDDVFAALYPDGGHCTVSHAQLLGDRFHLIENAFSDTPAFLEQVKRDFYEHLLPHFPIERNIGSKETGW